LTERERAILDERAVAARTWLEVFAPDRVRIAVRHDGVPAETAALEADQRAFLVGLADAVGAVGPSGGDAWQNSIFTAAESTGLPAGRAFTALYLAFLGRSNGPRAGWLLASLDPDFVVGRLRDAAEARPASVGGVS
jgi:lysyl-tRNA synthetase class 1